MASLENPKDGDSVKNEHNERAAKEKNKAPKVGQKRKRKGKEVAQFGNYRNYYGYRLGQELKEDPRLHVFRKEWFQDKDCLDIGCNSGLITISIARKFQCRSILGIDIDNDRIQDAYWCMRKINREMNCASLDGSKGRDLSEIVSFRKENFVQNWSGPAGKLYDTIICLSVSKWIHLNWGDDGLVTLFSRIWKLLQPGGILVLEPQPWSSYDKNRLVSETTAANCRSIMFYPNTFQELLLDKMHETLLSHLINVVPQIGFRTVEDLTSNLADTKKGFNRPILAFMK